MMKKTILALSLLVSGTVFAGNEIEAKDYIEPVCGFNLVEDDSGIGYNDRDPSSKASLETFSNYKARFEVSVKTEEVELESIDGRKLDSIKWKIDHFEQSEGESVVVNGSFSYGERIEVYPKIDADRSQMPAGEIEIDGIVTLKCHGK